MNNEQYRTSDYAKLFLLMIIPVYGFCFTFLLAFSKDVSDGLKSLARGALIARITFLFVIGIGGFVLISTIWPSLNQFISRLGIVRVMQ